MPVKIEITVQEHPAVLNGKPSRNVVFEIDGQAVGPVSKLESFHTNEIMDAIREPTEPPEGGAPDKGGA